jgi:hypothetical protein
MANNNKTMAKAKDRKNDEFYTQLTDIEKELKHYRKYFRNATIFCNCDDPEYSNFWLYFQLNFYEFGLKKLVSTHYKAGQQSYKMEIVATDQKEQIGIPDYVKTPLQGDGDFRSEECIEILKEADIVITNPPFSLFREYLAQLIEYEKKFIIIGNLTAIHYKEIFPLFQHNKMWLGATNFSGGATYFIGSKELYDPQKMSNPKHAYIKDDKLYWRVNGVRWFSNLATEKRFEKVLLYKTYTPEEYPHYINYDAIDVPDINSIPADYYDAMGVPDTFLQIYNPEQFEIVGYGRGDFLPEIGCVPQYFLDEYRANGGRGHITSGMKSLCYYDKNGKPKFPFSRIIIKRKASDIE